MVPVRFRVSQNCDAKRSYNGVQVNVYLSFLRSFLNCIYATQLSYIFHSVVCYLPVCHKKKIHRP